MAVAENQPVATNKNRVTIHSPFSGYIAQLREFIQRHSASAAGIAAQSSENEPEFDRLAMALFGLQFEHNAPYRRFCEAKNANIQTVQSWRDVPAMPVAGFKELDMTSLRAEQRLRVFHSSGTTGQSPSRHFHDAESLSLYEASLLPWFCAHGVPEANISPDSLFSKMRFLSLAPPPDEAPHSSLAHMFDAIHRAIGSTDARFTGRVEKDGSWRIDFTQTLAVLQESAASGRPLALLGTAFNFVHLLDYLQANRLRFRLPIGSRVMETGGYKGRARALAKTELHALITELLGIAPTHIICEYGMSELSSQAYDAVTGQAAGRPRLFRFPPWARAQIISPENGREAETGETGLIRVFDLANARSVMAVQTEDLGIQRDGGFELLGRAALTEARGCSLMSV